MKIAILKERASGETRVAATPETVKKFIALGAAVAVEAGAGEAASIPDGAYREAGAEIGAAAATVKGADIVLGVQAPNGETAFTRRGDLQLSVTGVLQTGNGHPVMGDGNTPITVSPDLKVSISDDGGVYVTNPAQPGVQNAELVGTLMLRDASETPLTRREDGLFKAHNKPSGSDFASGPMKVSVISQALEGSNVNPQEAMVKLIEQARMFEQQVRIIKSSTDNDQAGASMMKLNG